MTQQKILIMDDVEIDIEPLSEHLQAEGYQVLKALTTTEAKQTLEDTWVHLMIVDLNMIGTDNDDDRSGLEMVNNPEYAIIPKVILTGYADDPKVLRQMIKPSLDGKPLVIGFLGKGDGDIPNKIIDLFNGLPFNWDLHILWALESLRSLVGLAGLFIADEERIQVTQRIDELEDLFRKVFFYSQQIIVGRLFAYDAGVAWIEITAHRNSQVAEQFVVACGQKPHIKHQMCHYDLIPQGNTIRRVETFETLRFAATVYECLGGHLTELTSLQELFFRWSSQAIEETVNHLFGSTLAGWHKQRSSMHEIGNLRQLYEAWPQKREPNLGPTDWVVNIKDLCDKASTTGSLSRIDYSPEWLTLYISSQGKDYHNPIHFLLTKNTLLNAEFAFGIVHGHLHPINILVDFQKNVRLIDFSQVQEGPILVDFVALELTLKAELLRMVSVETWCAIEKQLLEVKSLNALMALDDLSPEVQKIIKTISIIRHRAASSINGSMKGYLAGLFVHSTTQLARYDREKVLTERELSSYLYYLISAMMICDHLTSPREFVPDFIERFVVVEGEKRSKLTPREWDLLKFMFARVNQPCGYKEILKEVYHDAPDDIEDGAWMASSGRPKVNAAIGRLREKLEPDSQNPKYILIEREYGYKLEI